MHAQNRSRRTHMIRVQQLKLPIQHTDTELRQKAAKTLKIPESQIKKIKIVKRSIDARKKHQVCYVYTLDISLQGAENDGSSVSDSAEQSYRAKNSYVEQKIINKVNSNNVMLTKEEFYHFPQCGEQTLKHPPVVVGSGPAGLFCAYGLAKMGYAPIVIERGKPVGERKKDVELFWKEGCLKPDSNVQFGEGGAGTFSDGKLNTLVKDVKGRNRMVLDTFISFGAPEKIAYEGKPHIGTDILINVVKNMRREIIRLGGTFLFETCMEDLEWKDNRISAVICRQAQEHFIRIETEVLVLAIGHSARDTFEMLLKQQLPMEAKSFAVGLRVEHPQAMISEQQYGTEAMKLLPAAAYKVTANLENGRGVYSFCMCPGGYVVNASSEPGRLAVNGMSYSGRDGDNANSAIIVSVTPQDYPEDGPLAGVAFQRELERRAYELGNGRIPQQLFGDFELKRDSTGYGSFASCTKGAAAFGSLHELFSEEIHSSFVAGMHEFSRYIRGFDRYDCILSGVESRTSSPVRIPRDEHFESCKKGLYPCGEGAGYAGGIMSAAMDGLKVAEAIIAKYRP